MSYTSFSSSMSCSAVPMATSTSSTPRGMVARRVGGDRSPLLWRIARIDAPTRVRMRDSASVFAGQLRCSRQRQLFDAELEQRAACSDVDELGEARMEDQGGEALRSHFGRGDHAVGACHLDPALGVLVRRPGQHVEIRLADPGRQHDGEIVRVAVDAGDQHVGPFQTGGADSTSSWVASPRTVAKPWARGDLDALLAGRRR